VKYFWLDFLCLDQIDHPNDDDEKSLQICIMGDIYKYAQRVAVLIGGMGAVLGADKKTPWMGKDSQTSRHSNHILITPHALTREFPYRSWTLQEAVINGENTWVHVNWPPGEPTSVAKPPRVGSGNFQLVCQ
jgi:hypothetical protein